jgi:hypothetical protein
VPKTVPEIVIVAGAVVGRLAHGTRLLAMTRVARADPPL